ncbi:MAG: hypothetical protein H7Y27_16325 [Gemmatimonadaceae bacterium]|nr:hypothetical protein [Chitinophagaceae bacterium]
MKRMALLAGCITMAGLTAIAQEKYIPFDTKQSDIRIKAEPKFSVNFHGGYAWALGSTFKFYPDDVRSIEVEMQDNTTLSKTMKYSSPKKGLGEGFRVGAGFSYVINDFLNAGIDIDYFRSTIRKDRDSSIKRTFTTGPITSMSYNERFTISYDAILLTFTPHITFKAVSRPKWFLYNKVGAVITIRPNSIENDRKDVNTSMTWQGFQKDSSGSSDTRYEWGIKNPSIGFMGAIGAQFKITEKIRLFSELQFTHIVFVISKRTTTNMIVNGKDIVNTLPVSERVVEFQTSFRDDDWVQDPFQPSRAVTQRIPITYVGIQAGIAYRF